MKPKNNSITVCYLIFFGLASLSYAFQGSEAALAQEKATASQIITDKPRLIILPLKPHEGHPYDGTGLAVQFLLGNVVALHPGLKEFWFGWRIDRVFPQEADFKNYCRGDGTQLDLLKLGKEQEITYWLQGRVQPQNSHLRVFLTLVDAGGKGPDHNTELILDPSDQLIGFRKGFLAWLETCGLPMPHTQAEKAMWPEETTLRALSLLGRALESHYLHSIGKHKAPLDHKLVGQAVSAAPASYMALDLKAWVLFKNKDYRAADAVFRSALKANSDGVGALSGLMWCAIRTDNEEIAYAWAGAKARILGESLAVANASVASLMGNAAYKAKAYGRAISLYQKATTWNPAKRLYVTKLALAYRKNAQFRHAIECIDTSLERFPTEEDRRALLINKADSLTSLAKSLRTARKYQEALDRFEQALVIDRIYRPKAAVEGLENLASIYDALGDHAHALESRQKALEMKRERSESQQ